MADYTLYWNSMTSSFAPHAILEEIGVDYELRWVDFKGKEQKSESFLKINPNGLIPVLLLKDGSLMYESAGMVMYLADRYPSSGLAPAVSDPDRHLYNQWLFYIPINIYQTYDRWYNSELYSTNPADKLRIRDCAVQDIQKYWQIIDDALQDRTWLIGDRFSACDIYMLMLKHWHAPRQYEIPNLPSLFYDDFFEQFPNISRLAAKVAERPVVQKIMKLYPIEDLIGLYERLAKDG
ncbi:glutathione S-transferase family protein [Calothrix rhizosoleniae]|uniref:glutathione S-transferase family protein n=1 Tax=Calothrix rhizosoleniae TaxID=888997 RepID=UPI000B49A20A|nr:glutathione S-transferase N-terminal domain-containing protein [Calothrix rhizosoleniae]